MLADAFIITVAALIADFILSALGGGIAGRTIVISIITFGMCSLTALFICGAYSKLWRYINSRDYLACVFGLTIGFGVSCVIFMMFERSIPRSYTFMHYLISLAGICSFRFLFRMTFITLVDTGINETKYTKTMIIGGGQACTMLLREIIFAHTQTDSNFSEKALLNPVCIIDDDTSKIGRNICGVEIVGTTADIRRFIKEKDVQLILFAIPSCGSDDRKRILDICSATGLPVKIIPYIGNLIFEDERTTILGQMRDIKMEDLLERDPITFDNRSVIDFITGKVCMVTGGGGSIGSELARQIAKYDPKRLIIVDIYENSVYDIQQELLMEYGGKLNLAALIASVRDYDRIDRIFGEYKPQIVFHAAAHKHVPLMELSPMEAVKNNVNGTYNCASLAQKHNAEKFVMISTDKAVNPTNVMGASKRCCEMIVQCLAQQHIGRTEFVTTRFGNVLGSNGSVIPLFKRQIEQGRPVTVTHPDIIRYFMTIPEAVSLVLEAAAIANGGEIFVLDMGKPVKILSLAENLIRSYGKIPYKDVEIVFTGLRPGEKLEEELLMSEEGLQKTPNERIFIGKQLEINAGEFIKKLAELTEAAKQNSEEEVMRLLYDIVPTFTTPDEYNKKCVSAKES